LITSDQTGIVHIT